MVAEYPGIKSTCKNTNLRYNLFQNLFEGFKESMNWYKAYMYLLMFCFSGMAMKIYHFELDNFYIEIEILYLIGI